MNLGLSDNSLPALDNCTYIVYLDCQRQFELVVEIFLGRASRLPLRILQINGF